MSFRLTYCMSLNRGFSLFLSKLRELSGGFPSLFVLCFLIWPAAAAGHTPGVCGISLCPGIYRKGKLCPAG